jgi:hypothetical protein
LATPKFGWLKFQKTIVKIGKCKTEQKAANPEAAGWLVYATKSCYIRTLQAMLKNSHL